MHSCRTFAKAPWNLCRIIRFLSLSFYALYKKLEHDSQVKQFFSSKFSLRTDSFYQCQYLYQKCCQTETKHKSQNWTQKYLSEWVAHFYFAKNLDKFALNLRKTIKERFSINRGMNEIIIRDVIKAWFPMRSMSYGLTFVILSFSKPNCDNFKNSGGVGKPYF